MRLLSSTARPGPSRLDQRILGDGLSRLLHQYAQQRPPGVRVQRSDRRNRISAAASRRKGPNVWSADIGRSVPPFAIILQLFREEFTTPDGDGSRMPPPSRMEEQMQAITHATGSWPVTGSTGQDTGATRPGLITRLFGRFAQRLPRPEDEVADRHSGCGWSDETERRVLGDIRDGRRAAASSDRGHEYACRLARAVGEVPLFSGRNRCGAGRLSAWCQARNSLACTKLRAPTAVQSALAR